MKRMMLMMFMVGIALPSLAFLTQPIGDDARTDAGEMRVTGSVTLESDVNLYGARFTYGLLDGVALFGGLGILDPDFGDSEIFFQLGGQYQLPVEAPVDLALRGAFAMTSWEHSTHGVRAETDIWILNFGLLASKEVHPQVTLYGFGGLSRSSVDVKVSSRTAWGGESRSSSDSETDLAIAGGALYDLTDDISFFGEIAHIDDLFVSIGGRYRF